MVSLKLFGDLLHNSFSLTIALAALDADVLFTIAASFATENALDKTNVALALADSLLVLCKPFGELGVMVCVFLTTLGVTSFITNSGIAFLFDLHSH